MLRFRADTSRHMSACQQQHADIIVSSSRLEKQVVSCCFWCCALFTDFFCCCCHCCHCCCCCCCTSCWCAAGLQVSGIMMNEYTGADVTEKLHEEQWLTQVTQVTTDSEKRVQSSITAPLVHQLLLGCIHRKHCANSQPRHKQPMPNTWPTGSTERAPDSLLAMALRDLRTAAAATAAAHQRRVGSCGDGRACCLLRHES